MNKELEIERLITDRKEVNWLTAGYYNIQIQYNTVRH